MTADHWPSDDVIAEDRGTKTIGTSGADVHPKNSQPKRLSPDVDHFIHLSSRYGLYVAPSDLGEEFFPWLLPGVSWKHIDSDKEGATKTVQ
jgi:hypothetical protein